VVRKRALAVLTLGAAVLLDWIPVGAAQTGDPSPGPVIATSQAAAPAPKAPSTFPQVEVAPRPQPIASSSTAGSSRAEEGDRPGETINMFRRINAPRPPIETGGRPTPASQDPPLTLGPLLTPTMSLPHVPTLVAPAPSASAAPASPLSLVVQAPERVGLGETVSYTLLVTNKGAAPVAEVTVRDRLPAGLQHPEGDYLESDLGTLAPGECKKLDLKARAVRPGTLVNQALVLSRAGAQASATATVVVDEQALVLRQFGPERPSVGRTSDYRLEVVNRSGRDVHAVQLQAQLSAGLDFVAVGGGGVYDAASRTVRWTLAALPAGQQQAVVLRLLPQLPGLQINQLLARSAEGQEVHLQTPLQVQAANPPKNQAAVRLKVVGPDEVLTVGKELVYEVHVANPGPTALKGVQVAALLPAGVMPRRGEGPVPARVEGQQVIFAPLPSLAPRAQVVLRVRVYGHQPGAGVMRVRLLGDPSGVPLFRDFNMMVVRLETAGDCRA